MKNKKWTKKENQILIKYYSTNGLEWVSKKITTRTKKAIQGHIVVLKLKLDKNSLYYQQVSNKKGHNKGKKRPKHSKLMKKLVIEGKIPAMGKKTEEDKKRSSENAKKRIKKNGHPRGMLGKSQTKKCKQLASERSNKMWADPNSKLNSQKNRQRISNNNVQLHKKGILGGINAYSNAKRGWYINGTKKYYMRSGWELNYACYLDFLVKQKQIKNWEYEVDTFWFEKIKRGVRSYKPDFKIFNLNKTIEYHEVKGYMDAKSKTKLKRMKIYYPKIKLILIDAPIYKDIMKYKKLYKANY